MLSYLKFRFLIHHGQYGGNRLLQLLHLFSYIVTTNILLLLVLISVVLLNWIYGLQFRRTRRLHLLLDFTDVLVFSVRLHLVLHLRIDIDLLFLVTFQLLLQSLNTLLYCVNVRLRLQRFLLAGVLQRSHLGLKLW